MSPLPPPPPSVSPPRILTKSQKLFYGVGHVLNDLCSNTWFSYILIYMTKVAGLSNSKAGLVLLIGQFSDGLSTLFVGWCCDHTRCTWYGKRKLWHCIGTICVLISFPFIFNRCLPCSKENDELTKMFYYSGFVISFQFGWACVQISHLALIPEITTKQSQTVELNAIRSGLTFVCGIFIFCITWFLLGSSNGQKVDTSVAKDFLILSIIVVGVGSLFSLIFQVGTQEPKCKKKLNNKCIETTALNENVDTEQTCPTKSCKMWLKDARLYKTGIVFLCTRLSIYIFASFFPLYLTEALGFEKEAIAYFPLIVLISGAATSSIVKYISKAIGCKLTYIFGALLIVASSIWLFVINKSSRDTVYGAAWLTGSGSSIILVTSLAKTADVIGKDKKSGAFVYSALSFSYKFLTGLVIFVIQHFKPTSIKGVSCSNCELVSKLVQSAIPGFFALVGLISYWLLFPSDFECRRKREFANVEIQTTEFLMIEKETQYEEVELSRQNENVFQKQNNFDENLCKNVMNINDTTDNRFTEFDEKMGVISLDSFNVEGFLTTSPRFTNIKEISC